MAANSKHWADVEIWIRKVIDSCKTDSQIRSARTLVHNYTRLYKELPYVMVSSLRYYLDNRFYEIIEKRNLKQ